MKGCRREVWDMCQCVGSLKAREVGVCFLGSGEPLALVTVDEDWAGEGLEWNRAGTELEVRFGGELVRL